MPKRTRRNRSGSFNESGLEDVAGKKDRNQYCRAIRYASGTCDRIEKAIARTGA